MDYHEWRLPIGMVPVLLAVAVLGYLAGHGSSQRPRPEMLRSTSAANVVLDYPSNWRSVPGAPGIPGLSVVDAIVLAPGGDATHAGLLVGSLARGALSPLPDRFVASLRRPPQTELVNFPEIQAYRYAQVSVPGFDRTLTIFVIPNPSGDATALACYAPGGQSADMRACEQTVATVTIVGQSQTYELNPEADYARKISASIESLDRLRGALKREMPPQATASTVRTAAVRLAGGFASAARSLSALEPSFGARAAQIALSASILRARDAYIALASAAREENASRYATARAQVSGAETDVKRALENFALLGYEASTPA